jgi:hypothetical protein
MYLFTQTGAWKFHGALNTQLMVDDVLDALTVGSPGRHGMLHTGAVQARAPEHCPTRPASLVELHVPPIADHHHCPMPPCTHCTSVKC